MEVIPVHFYNVIDNLKIGSEAMHCAKKPTRRWCQTIILATIIVATLGGCNESPGEDYLFFEPADHYDVVNVNEGLDLLWTFTPDEQIKNPVVLDGKRAAYFHTPKAVYSVNPADGSLRWRQFLACRFSISKIISNTKKLLDFAACLLTNSGA